MDPETSEGTFRKHKDRKEPQTKHSVQYP